MRCLPLCALLPAAAFAQTTAPAAAPVELDRVQVTATRLPETARDVPASVSVIERDDGRVDTLGAALSERLTTVPGLLARDRRNYAQDEQISIRGFGTRASFGIRGVRLYLDGVPATMPDGQGQVSHMPLAFARRIEILRGPFSVSYGNASGGVIQVFTDDPASPGSMRATAAYGSDAARRVSFEANDRGDALGWLAGAQHFATDGFREHSAAERNTLHGKLAFDAGATRATLVVDALAAPNAQDPGGLDRDQFARDPAQAAPTSLLFDTRKSVDQRQLGAVVEHDARIGTLRAMAYAGRRDVEQFLAIPVGTQRNPLSGGGVIDLGAPYSGIDVRWTSREAPLQWVAGIAWDRQRQDRRGYENFVGDRLGVRGALRADQTDRVDAFDPFLQATWRANDAWSFSAGVRHSRVRFRSDDHYITADNPDDSGRLDYSATSPVLGANWRANDAVSFYAAYGEGFETPTFNELQYRSDGGSGLNFALNAATTRSAEAGMKVSRGGLRTELALFRAQTDDELTVGTSAGGRTTFQNAGHAQRTGLELSGAVPLGDAWEAEFALTWLDAHFTDGFLACAGVPCTSPSVPVPAGTRIPGIPRTAAQAALRWGGDIGWHARIEGLYVGAVPVNNFGDERAAAYAVFGASAGYGFVAGDGDGRVFLAIDNLGDRTYAGSVIVNESNRRYYEPAPDRGFTVGVEWRWR
ncbi:TonB-dependent receptor [Lysobacter sp. A6]|uniref:TonB-dependent receptor n=1 Tax=Noviluteimonas lactosilytica TaxID=2888523 RepID=A0ABS8JL11_9GAMM|nr:TonB-dependent receptor [Lysobacter lactosilyticus]MCC8364309.1 TonB-dependent receptor [Lysobacter lactosilyticus]